MPTPSIAELHRPGAASNVLADSAPAAAMPPPPGFARLRSCIGLPQVSEVDVVRHFTRLSQESHGVDNGPYPLGSCTMKYNPKRNDELARLPGFACAHPMQDADTLGGVWEMYERLQAMVCEITGMDACCLAPAAGAQGEFAGLLMIRRHFARFGVHRPVVLVPDSAHGTNPASAAMAGFACRIVPSDAKGRVDRQLLRAMLTPEVAAFMLTNPSTLGLFEDQIVEIADAVHANGSLLYYDGANLNALMGIVRPGDMGFDLVHVNVHKTFSTPHGGGGPGAGPVAVKAALAQYLPGPVVVRRSGLAQPDGDRPLSIGRIKAFHGHVGVLLRAYGYLRTMGARGLRQASENAVLNANYLQHRLAPMLPPVYAQLCKHETLLSGAKLKTSVRQFAKRLIDYGIHPPTLVGAGCVYFPGDLKSAMLIEPTETETKASLDCQVDIFQRIFNEDAMDETLDGGARLGRKMARIDGN
ncbi:aminomethyl-transferring glycine dehydrogenase subunit GcvPB [Verminephrobacter aporrectodeae]|uniref:glycine dehydrogenase (aminomethyl-transferring) n=1 Tax=Verminephrobacter aporrectodeae subsp. tuberculatae TaxID=1110392 RepID=A0ABT3KNX5_9BURK|nr:aminomethyl-transferring glycine dehydrogenase subunit GcvPB [Verminephrobacter aporrectodeae]MCW5320023.1 aminotransferase class V-fold PLP-dependent enzyme [Verminephrobacter aporrectodeae subsp. tuberculatae]MCW8175403.1 aminotransferase class V-fold PLP-dependent enzyme [Verminephrobacter aporrectodeae subsp. tuberculatae]MCW8203348.1 aminotransferase class V-fold PLP-dependent enzyme [Verminephrobacter aporrectodeae subsp. tuberculatae]